MAQKFVLRTLLALSAWLFLENFNVAGSSAWSRPAGAGKSTESVGTAKPSAAKLFPAANAAYRIRKVVLDAGHGGKDPGCSGHFSKEKNNTLAIILQLGARIKANFPEVQVIYTRDADVFVELKERAAIANRNNADLFISVHCNSISTPYYKGAETYVMGLHTASHNLEVAKRENASIYLEDNYKKDYAGYDPDSPEAHILGSVWQSAYLEQSILFASLVQRFAKEVAGREDRGVKQAGFLVLRETAMPAVLVESGYLTNRSEDEFISSAEGQAQVADAIFEAFRAYKEQMEGGELTQNRPAAEQTPHSASKTLAAPVSQENRPENTAPSTSFYDKLSEKPAGTANSKNNLQYRIVLLTWPVRMDTQSGLLGLLSNVKEEKADGAYKYFVGNFATRNEADKMLPELRNLGFKTAVIEAANQPDN